MSESARKAPRKSLKPPKPTKIDSNRAIIRTPRTQPRVRAGRDFGDIAAARRDMLNIAKDYSPRAMLRICEMGGLVDGVEPAISEQVRFACCQEVLDRAHGRPRAALGDANAGPLLVDFAWASDAPTRLLEAAAIGDSDGDQ